MILLSHYYEKKKYEPERISGTSTFMETEVTAGDLLIYCTLLGSIQNVHRSLNRFMV
jgi:hypothetical protein